MKKIAIIADALDFQYAGIKVYLEGLTEALSMVDQENEYAIIRAKADIRAEAGNIYVKSTISKYLHPKSRLLIEIPKAIKSIAPDIVIEPCHFGPYGLPDKVKKITLIHDLTPISHPQFHPRDSVLLHKLLLPGTIKNADLIITNSKKTKKDLVEKYPFAYGKTEVIYPGMTKAKISGGPIEEDIVIPENFILHVGTIEPRKNLDFLLDIFEAYKTENHSNLRLVLVGERGWKTASFDAKYEAHPFKEEIDILGYIPEPHLIKLYKSARALVYPSHYEGFGLPLLEAMYYGCPIITSNSSSQSEVCQNAAIILDNNEANEWALQLSYLIANDTKRLELINRGKERAPFFDWNKSALELIELMKNLSNEE